MDSIKKGSGFTLAEVLIVLVVIGVVSALTIPILASKINAKVKSIQMSVIEKKFVQGLNLFNNLENGLSGRSYLSTKDFVEGLSKHTKLVSICSSEDLQSCFGYSKIKFENNDGVEEIGFSEILRPSNMRLSNSEYLEPAGFVTASGIPFVISFNKNCLEDIDKPLSNISECIAGFYDYNGTKAPNKVGEDIVTFNGAKFGCLAKANGSCLVSLYKADTNHYLDKSQCENYLGVGNCPVEKDYWAWGKLQCEKDGGRLLTSAELTNIYDILFNSNENSDGTITYTRSKIGEILYPALGKGNVFLYSTKVNPNDNSKISVRSLSSSPSVYGYYYEPRSNAYSTVCLGD